MYYMYDVYTYKSIYNQDISIYQWMASSWDPDSGADQDSGFILHSLFGKGKMARGRSPPQKNMKLDNKVATPRQIIHIQFHYVPFLLCDSYMSNHILSSLIAFLTLCNCSQ